MEPTRSTSDAARIWTCDGCSCWTNRPVTPFELTSDWYWEISEEDGDVVCYCPDCQ